MSDYDTICPELPPATDDLEKIAPEFRDAYESDGAGRFRMRREAAELADAFMRDWTAAEEAHAAKLAEMDGEIARMNQELVNRELRRALREAGIAEGFLSAAAAMIAEEYEITVEPERDIGWNGPHGRAGVDFIVRNYLASDAGQIFRSEPQQGRSEPGPLTAELRRLRERLH